MISGKAIISVSVLPNKPKSKFVGISDDGTIRIDIKAQAIEGKANQELVRFLSKSLKVNINQVLIMRGINSRKKLIKIESMDKERILEILEKKRD